ncbi:MAG: P-II family nitrogen regulator [Methanothrix sp.]|nr:P-II family nitrogen regulator [Methanothrix sp.]
MKEILAIIQMNKIDATKEALNIIGIPSLTVHIVYGRGKQRGLRIPNLSQLEGADQMRMKFIPKRMISLIVKDGDAEKVIKTIIEVNQTGQVGDGRIFVSPIDNAVRVRTGEEGNEALG